MKKTTMKMLGMLTIAAALAMTTMTACSSDNDLVETPNSEQATGMKVTVTAGISDDAATRSEVAKDGTKRTLKFTAGDRLYVFRSKSTDTKLASYLDIDDTSISDDGKSATFSGTLVVYTIDGDNITPFDSYVYSDDPLEGTTATLVHRDVNTQAISITPGKQAEANYNQMQADDVETLMTTALLVSGGYDTNTKSYTLACGAPILNCTISGLNATTGYTVSLKKGDEIVSTHSVTTDAARTATIAFAASEKGEGAWKIVVKESGSSEPTGTIDLGTINLGAKVYNVKRHWTGSAFIKAVSGDVNLADLTEGDVDLGNATLTGTLANNVRISIASGAIVTLNGVTIEGKNYVGCKWAGLECLGDATIILADGTTNTVKGFHESQPGISVNGTHTLTIQGNGTLNASSNGKGAGIGGGWNQDCGSIVIDGGVINATGGEGAAGIGGGFTSTCDNITINGGSITATGGSTSGEYSGAGAAGIGSGGNLSAGSVYNCGHITINGGYVTATGGYEAAGIGTGTYATCRNITIENTVGKLDIRSGGLYIPSIGSGLNGTRGTLTIFDTVYSEDTGFTTHYTYVSGFSVNGSGTQIHFAPGNLQAKYTGNISYGDNGWEWSFAEHQWDYIGNNPGNISLWNKEPYINPEASPATVDLFGRSTNNSYYGINCYEYDDPYQGDFVDWGNQVISGDPKNTWRTLSIGEWEYLLNSRTGASQKYASAIVNNVRGLVLLPDVWTLPAGCSFIAGMGDWGRNVYNATQWASMEAYGAVFLPAAGYREGTTIETNFSLYWTSTPYLGTARTISFGNDLWNNISLETNQIFNPYFGCSVRLVK